MRMNVFNYTAMVFYPLMRQLDIAMATLHEVRFNPIIAHALAEIEAIGREGEVDAAIDYLESSIAFGKVDDRLVFRAYTLKVCISALRLSHLTATTTYNGGLLKWTTLSKRLMRF